MKAGAPTWIKSLASFAHSLIAGVSPIAVLYLAALRCVIRGLPSHFRQRVLNSLATADWPASALGPREVVLASDTRILLHPHNGEFDFAAVLGGRMQYEQEVFKFLDLRMDQYDVVIEIGANVGVFTVYFGKKLEKTGGRVHAFEPSRMAYDRLRQNMAANGLKNISSYGVAVGAEAGVAFFYEPEGHLTNGSLVSGFAEQFSAQVKAEPVVVISAATLAQMLDARSRVLVKVDVEGSEAPLIRALAPLFQKVRPDILIEVLPEYEREINAAVCEATVDYLKFAITQDGLQAQETLHAIGGRDCFLMPLERGTRS